MMNVELVNPILVFGLFARSDAPQPKPSLWRSAAWAKRVLARLDEKL